MKNKVKNSSIRDFSKGFSLIEVVVSMGIVGVLMLFVLNLSVLQQKQLNTINSKYERTDLVQEIRQILSDRSSCVATLGGRNPNAEPVGSITEIISVRGLIDNASNGEASNTLLSDLVPFVSNSNESLAQTYGNDKIKFLGFSLSTNGLTTVVPNARGITYLSLDAISPEGSYARRTAQRIRVNLETDSSGNIITCGVNKTLGISLASMCSSLGGRFDESGRGGVGNCFSLKLTEGLTVNGDLHMYDSSLAGEDGGVNFAPTLSLDSGFDDSVGGDVTAKSFCDTLGGEFVAAGRSGVGDCQNMQIDGGVSMGLSLNVTNNMTFNDGAPTPNAPAASSPLGTNMEDICNTLGGAYDPIGRDGNGDCKSINSTTSMSVLGDVSTKVIMGLN